METLLANLESIRRKVKLFGVLFGIGNVIAIVVALLLATVLVDYVFNLHALPRMILLLITAGGAVYAFNRWVIRPAMTKLSLGDIAGRLENTFPQFDDRLRSTVNFAAGKEIPGSEAMKEKVVAQAAELARSLDLNRAIELKPVWYSVGTAGGAIVFVLLLGMLVNPQLVRIALARLLSPFAATEWPRTVQIDLVGDLPRRLPVGQKLDVKMKLSRGDRASRKAIIHYRYGDGAEQIELMQRGEDGVYTASLDARIDAEQSQGLLSAWIESGDGIREIPQVAIVPRLGIKSVEAIIAPPKYTGLPARTVNLSQNQAIVPAGASVEIRAYFNKTIDPNKPATLELLAQDAQPRKFDWTPIDPRTITTTWSADTSMRFRLHATDTDGFQNSAIEEFEIIVRPDQNPTVQIENPRRNEDRTAVATVPLAVVAEDDYAVGTLKLMVDRVAVAGATTQPADQTKHWEIVLYDATSGPAKSATWNRVESSAERLRSRASYPWDLAQLEKADLKPGDVLEYYALVADTYDLAGAKHPPVPSGKLRITIISQEDLANRVTDELRNAADQINSIKTGENRTLLETTNLAKDLEKKPQLDNADKAAMDRLANQQSTAASQAKQVAAKLDQILQKLDENKSPNAELRDIAKDVSAQLNQTAEKPMKAAAARINEAKEPSQKPTDRLKKLEAAKTEQQKASDELQKALDRMGNIGSLQSTIDAFRDILADQQKTSKDTADVGKSNLGKTPEQMSPADREKLEKAVRDQENLAARTEKAIADMQKIAAQLAKSDPATSEAMKSAAQTGKSQNVSGNQSKASQAAANNQQSAAQGAQKQAELGLQMIIDSLREAERRKLEELARKLADLQKQVENLIRRQSGHNLDNLTLQGPERLAKVESKEMEVLLAASERSKDNLPPAPTLPQLSTTQEQTERNTRDIAQVAEGIPDGTEAAGHLTRAAGKMERAIVSLREGKLADAYEPPQVEALTELLEAKKIIDEQKKKADDKQNEKKKEAIRLVYIKIREDQDKVNKDTARIDSAPKLADGSLKREDAVRLGQLPGEQGAISDRTAKVEEDLSALGSVVYIWANKDIVSTMNEVKVDLGKPETGQPTQAEQARVVEQLDAMIRNLALKPPDDKFEDRNSGGGGGGGGKKPPTLPTEAELRLLKDLQTAINQSTKTIDQQQKKDEPKLISLGTRQGQLRGVLDQLLQKSSNGQTRLGPEPDKIDQLPEEANQADVEDQELEQELLSDKPDAEKIEKDVNRIGDRMARVRQRLAISKDPGKVTQIIEDRIIKDLDELIKSARKQKSQPSTKPSGDGQQQPPPQPNNGAQPQNANAGQQPQPNSSTPAQDSTLNPAGVSAADLSKDIREKMSEWGGITPRQREAVIEGADETVIEKYKKLVDDYYRTLATKSTDRER